MVPSLCLWDARLRFEICTIRTHELVGNGLQYAELPKEQYVRRGISSNSLILFSISIISIYIYISIICAYTTFVFVLVCIFR